MLPIPNANKGWALRLTDIQWAVLVHLSGYPFHPSEELASVERIARCLSSPKRKIRKRDVREALYSLVAKEMLPPSFVPSDHSDSK